jgi:hypothetical protein
MGDKKSVLGSARVKMQKYFSTTRSIWWSRCIPCDVHLLGAREHRKDMLSLGKSNVKLCF